MKNFRLIISFFSSILLIIILGMPFLGYSIPSLSLFLVLTILFSLVVFSGDNSNLYIFYKFFVLVLVLIVESLSFLFNQIHILYNYSSREYFNSIQIINFSLPFLFALIVCVLTVISVRKPISNYRIVKICAVFGMFVISCIWILPVSYIFNVIDNRYSVEKVCEYDKNSSHFERWNINESESMASSKHLYKIEHFLFWTKFEDVEFSEPNHKC